MAIAARPPASSASPATSRLPASRSRSRPTAMPRTRTRSSAATSSGLCSRPLRLRWPRPEAGLSCRRSGCYHEGRPSEPRARLAMRILCLTPIGTDVYNSDRADLLARIARPGTEIEFVSLPEDRPKHVEYHSYEALALPDIVRHVRAAADKFDAVIIT